MKNKTKVVKINSQNRVQEISKEEMWLFDPKNREIVKELKEALKQKAERSIDLSLFEEE